ncbi:MAG: ATP-binding cassette domain-containing protein [Peptococcaceae bacterium]|nr:ATP-binding cassette domain-containing protein [Peptococcaceae bacterium]
MGPSGAGKTTLLRFLSLLDLPTEGLLAIDGQDVRTLDCRARLRLRRRMTMVFQKPILFNTSVFENVAYGLRIRGISGNKLRRAVSDALAWVGLRDLAGRNARTLSGGEAQRIALARAAVLETDVLLLDEATANLDPANVALMEDLILKLNRQKGVTIIMVTHNVFQTKRLADEVVFMWEGKVVETGPAAAVFSNPRDERTRAFIEGRAIY